MGDLTDEQFANGVDDLMALAAGTSGACEGGKGLGFLSLISIIRVGCAKPLGIV